MLDCHWFLIIHSALYINRYGILVLIYSFSYTNFFNALFNSFLSLCHYIIFFMMVIWLFHDGHLTFSRWSPDFFMMVTWLFHDGQRTFSRWSADFLMWSADFLNVGKLLFPGDPLTFSLWSPDFLTMVTWLSQCFTRLSQDGHLTFSIWSPNWLGDASVLGWWSSVYKNLPSFCCNSTLEYVNPILNCCRCINSIFSFMLVQYFQLIYVLFFSLWLLWRLLFGCCDVLPMFVLSKWQFWNLFGTPAALMRLGALTFLLIFVLWSKKVR